MKRYFVVFLSAAFILSCGNNNEYTIKGTFSDEPDEEWVYLVEFSSDEPGVDSARIENGEFFFEGTTDFLDVYAISNHWTLAQQVFPIFLEPAGLKVEIDPDNWERGSEISGGPVNEQYMEFREQRTEKFLSDIWELNEKKEDADEKEREKIEERIDELSRQDRAFRIDYMQNNPESPLSLFILSGMYRMIEVGQLGNILESLSSEIKQTRIYRNIEGYHETQLALKESVPYISYKEEIEIDEVNFGEAPVISELAGFHSGKPLYITIWGTWCGICKDHFQHTRELFEKFEQQELGFVFVCIQSNQEGWKEMIQDEQLEGYHYLLNAEMTERLYEEIEEEEIRVPKYITLNREGELIDANAPNPAADNIEEILLELIE